MVSIKVDLLGAKLNIPMLYGGILFMICFIELLKQYAGNCLGQDKGLSIISILFLASCFISVFFSSDKYESFASCIKISTWVILLLISRNVFQDKKDLILISKMAFVTSLIIILSYIASTLGIYGNQTGGYKYYDYKIDVAVGYFYNAVSIAYPLAFCTPMMMLGATLSERPKTYIIGALSNIFFILVTYVRTPLIALCIGFVSYSYIRKKYQDVKFSKYVIVGGFTFAVILFAFQLFQPKTSTSRWIELYNQVRSGQYEKLASGRVGLALNAINYQLEKQTITGHIFGLGIGNSGSVSKSKKVVHNSFLEVWLGCGLLGFVLYVMLLIRLWRNLKSLINVKNEKFQKSCFLAIMSYFIFLVSNMDVILTAVFPLSIAAVHIGCTIGNAKQLAEINLDDKESKYGNQP